MALVIVARGGAGWGAFWLWAAALAALPLALARAQGSAPLAPLRPRERAAVFCALTLGIGLRVYRWAEIPPGLWADELLAAGNGLRVWETWPSPLGTLPLVPDWPTWVHTFNLYSYGVAGVLRVFGIGHLGVKMISILPGILLLPALYGLTRRVAGPRAALAATLTLALSRWGLTQSRFEWDATLHVALATLCLWALARGIHRGRWAPMATAGVLLGLAQFTYLASRLTAAALIAGLALVFVLGRRGRPGWRRAQLPGLLAFGGALVLAAAPVAHFTLAQEDVAKARIEQLQLGEEGIFAAPERLLGNARLYAGAFTEAGPGNGRQNIPRAPLLPDAVAALAALGALACLRGRRRPMGPLLWAAFAGALAAGILSQSEDGPNAHRMALALPVVCAWAGLGLDALLRLGAALVARLGGHRGISHGLGALAFLGLGLVGARESWVYFTDFGASRAHWAAVGSGPQLRAAEALAPHIGTHAVFVDEALRDRTFDILLYTPPGPEGGGIDDPAFQTVHLSPRGMLPEGPGDRPALLLVHPRNVPLLAAQLGPWTPEIPLDPFGHGLYALYTLPPGALAATRRRLLDEARGVGEGMFVLEGDLQGPGLLRLDRERPRGPVVGAALSRDRLVRALPPPPQPIHPRAMEWWGHLYVDAEGAYRFARGQRGAFRLEIDGAEVDLSGDVGISLSAGRHDLRILGRGGRFDRVTLLWAPPGAERLKTLPMGALRPRLPPGITLRDPGDSGAPEAQGPGARGGD